MKHRQMDALVVSTMVMLFLSACKQAQQRPPNQEQNGAGAPPRAHRQTETGSPDKPPARSGTSSASQPSLLWRPGSRDVPGRVTAMATYDDGTGVQLFMVINESRTPLIKWDGVNLSTPSSGFDGWGNALAVFGGRLIAGGSFTTAGGVACRNIAAWDGMKWSPLGSGLPDKRGPEEGEVSALTVFNGQLVAAGNFVTTDGLVCLAKWDGHNWSPLGPAIDGGVYALAVLGDHLVIAGSFDTAGGVACKNIAEWNGSKWSPLGSGIDGQVRTMVAFDGELVVGGAIGSAGGAQCNGVAKWSGSDWSSMGAGTTLEVNALTAFEDQLLAGGVLGGWPNGVQCHCIARWDGRTWSPEERGITAGIVCALAVFRGDVITGGQFIDIESEDSSRWAIGKRQ